MVMGANVKLDIVFKHQIPIILEVFGVILAVFVVSTAFEWVV
jgi:hypothetical protein